MKLGNLNFKHARGLWDKAVGLNKEVVGTVVGSDRLAEEGQSQQERGTESLKALREEAKAQAKEAKAQSLEAKQRTAQRVKENA